MYGVNNYSQLTHDLLDCNNYSKSFSCLLYQYVNIDEINQIINEINHVDSVFHNISIKFMGHEFVVN